MRVKVCGLKDIDNMQSVIELAPDFVGLIFHKESKRYVGDDEAFKQYVHSIDGVMKTGVFVNATVDDVISIANDYKLDFVQLHGDQSSEFCASVNNVVPVIKVFRIDASLSVQEIQRFRDVCCYFLFDTKTEKYGGSGRKFNWELLEEYSLDKPFFLSGGIGPDDLGQIKQIDNRFLECVDINSRFEDSIGLKNINQLKTFIDELRNR
jgi:phosphoribosylanthranilate isomerase